MTAIIFGIGGQDGFYLKQILTRQGIEVIGISRSVGDWITGDIGNFDFVSNIIRESQPQYVFHFAANSTVRHDVLFENHHSISTGSLNVLESCFKFSKHTKVFLSGSAVQFENSGSAINELTPFLASSPYAVDRISSVYAARYYRTLGLGVYVGYFFNHDSPLRTDRHVNQKIVSAVKRIKSGISEKLEIGDLSVRKEFNYAGDMMEAIWILVNQQLEFEAVIGSGNDYCIEDWVKACFSKVSLNWNDFVVVNPNFKSEYKVLVSDPSIIMSLGWKPKTNFQQLVDLMMSN